MQNKTNKAKFTMRHYNAIHAVIKNEIKEHKQNCNLINGVPVSNEDMYYLIGMKCIHEKLGELFANDNPKFKAELWDLK